MTEQAALIDHGAAIRNLSERWLETVAADDSVRSGGGDFACSPAGLWLALAAAAAGAKGVTAQELRDLLGAAEDEAATATTEVARALAHTDALAVATGAWTCTPVHRAFREALPDIGFGNLDPDDLSAIDSWVKEATGGLIEKLPADPDEGTLLLLVNALALTARWESPFAARRTGPGDFTDAVGRTHQVATMRRLIPVGDAWTVPSVDGRATTVVELRCAPARDGKLPATVRFVLGPQDAPAAHVLPASWAPHEARTAFDADDVSVALPRLDLRTNLAVTPHLEALGIREATGDDADFCVMSPEPLTIDKVVQECLVRVAEKGVEAAAVTMVPMGNPGGRPRPRRIHRIAFDRPFGLVVLDGSGEVPLFTAWQATAPRDVPAARDATRGPVGRALRRPVTRRRPLP
ncbi:serpin family protein [Streptomyces sp. NPDC048638]|uniref:serpin family protein n=1 Tax=Streptomyces sp. NPDC048638 TaxID=3365580 RepID=UPI0037148735